MSDIQRMARNAALSLPVNLVQALVIANGTFRDFVSEDQLLALMSEELGDLLSPTKH